MAAPSAGFSHPDARMPSESLPIDAFIPEIVTAIRSAGAVVVVAEPGAGKTTRIPPALVKSGLAAKGQVVVLQPRRVAARAAARRIAEEHGSEVGDWAGYQVRFENRTSAATRIRVVTEGILMRALQSDPELRGVDAVVLDEFHERSIHADLALALVRDVRAGLRPDLRLVVMSATLEAEPVAAYLGGVPIVRVPGRQFPLEVKLLEQSDDRPIPIRAVAGVRRAVTESEGDILVFLPGAGEISRTAEGLADLARERRLVVLPLHGEMRAEDQDRVLQPSKERRVILATNVAETSLTVPGVRIVVDTGMARILTHDQDHGMDRLELRRISRASATQRGGRAGRLGPGVVYRMWTKSEESQMAPHDTPEIRRIDLAGPVLELRAWGETDLRRFGWFEAPDPAALERAERLLVRLGALDPSTLAPTALGRALVRVPAHPRVARILAEGHRRGAPGDAASIAALLSERDVVFRRAADLSRTASLLPTGPSDVLARRDLLEGGRGRHGDLDSNAVRSVERARDQFRRVSEDVFGKSERGGASEDDLLAIVFSGYVDRVARRRKAQSAEAVMVGGRGLVLTPESVVRDDELFVVIDGDMGRRGEFAKAQVRQASAVRRAWLDRIPGAMNVSEETAWDAERQRAVTRRRTRYEDLVLDDVEIATDPVAGAQLLLDAARKDPHAALDLTGSVGDLITRLRCLAEWMPELSWPGLTDAEIVAALEPWLDGKSSVAALRAIPLHDVLLGRLSRDQRKALDDDAPEVLDMPSGSRRGLKYEVGKAPVLAVRLQELFGQPETPSVARGRVRVILHLLAPNMQVVQVTQDLRSFWNTTYQQVRKDLRGRYPKHSWPEDPWTAQPTARAKPRR